MTRAGTPTAVLSGGISPRTTESAVVPDLERSEDLCARADKHVVAYRRMALAAVLACAAEGDAVVYEAVVAYLRSLAYHDAHAVVNDKALADLCAGVYLYPGTAAAHLRDEAGDELHVMLVKPVRPSVAPHRLDAGVQQQHLKCALRRRVSGEVCVYRFLKIFKHNITPQKPYCSGSARRCPAGERLSFFLRSPAPLRALSPQKVRRRS